MRFCKIVVAITVAALLALAYWQPFAEEIRAESVAKIFDDKGHGSAVYIGKGYFVSAAHVVGQEPVVNLLLTDGRKIKGDVLWSNTRYDIALVKSGPLLNVEASRLSCTVPAVGVMLAPSGFTRSIVGIGYVVPGRAICELMARV